MRAWRRLRQVVAGRRERPGAVVSKVAHLSGPVRTCVGCRTRGDKPALVRVVVVDAELAVDRAGRLPGRGAYVHPDLACVDLADRRRAFSRALRVSGPLDVEPVRDHLRTTMDRTAPAPPAVHSQ